MIMNSSYLQYLEICSKLVRNCLKEPHKTNALKRGEYIIKKITWENGKVSQSDTFGSSNTPK